MRLLTVPVRGRGRAARRRYLDRGSAGHQTSPPLTLRNTPPHHALSMPTRRLDGCFDLADADLHWRRSHCRSAATPSTCAFSPASRHQLNRAVLGRGNLQPHHGVARSRRATSMAATAARWTGSEGRPGPMRRTQCSHKRDCGWHRSAIAVLFRIFSGLDYQSRPPPKFQPQKIAATNKPPEYKLKRNLCRVSRNAPCPSFPPVRHPS